MDFFTAPPPLDRAPVEERAVPAWVSPPTEVLGAISPIEQMLFRSDTLIIALGSAVVFPEGAIFKVHMGARRVEGTDEDTWRARRELLMRGRVYPDYRPGTQQLDDEILRFGVRFPDGSKATTVDGRAEHGGDWPPPRPDGPILRHHGGGGSGVSGGSAHGRWSMWLWPLPPPEPFEFAVEWPAFDVPLTFTEIDGGPI
jgi:hypothetical protein